MVLNPGTEQPVNIWFPRPRGDGPCSTLITASSIKVPPPTRGWSLLDVDHRVFDKGSPAHAGMVPPPAPRLRKSVGFPRPRGDGPSAGSQLNRVCMVPPPTRGWSHVEVSDTFKHPGSPAHAGMVPILFNGLEHRKRFPRPRGDGPHCDRVSLCQSMVPPPTRGWSLCFPRVA